MFWGKKPNDTKAKKASAGKAEAPQNRDDLHEQAMANVRAARAHIGEETLDKIAAAMTKKQQSATEQAKRQIQDADPDRVLDELLYMLNEQKT